MTRFAVVWLATTTALLATACRTSQPTKPPDLALSESEELEPAALCDASGWVAATVCSTESCKVEALGMPCMRALQELSNCSGDDCLAECATTLGEARCRFPENRVIAARFSAMPEGREDGIVVGARPIAELYGASPDGSLLVVNDSRPFVGEGGDVVITAGDVDLWRFREAGDEEICHPPVVSPGGEWVARACGAVLEVRELESSFVRARLDIPALEVHRPMREDMVVTANSFGDERWFVYRGPSGWQRHDLETGETLELGDVIRAEAASAAVAVSGTGDEIAWSDGARITIHDLSREVPDIVVDLVGAAELAWNGPSLVALGNEAVWRLDETGAITNERELQWGPRTLEPVSGGLMLLEAPEGVTVAVSDPFDESSRRVLRPAPDYLSDPYLWGEPRVPMISGAAPLDGGRVAVASPTFGITFFDVAGAQLDVGLGRGPVAWFAADGPEHVWVAHPDGVRRWNLQTGEVEGLPVPAEFAQLRLRRTGDVYVGLELAESESFVGPRLVPSGNIVVIDGDQLRRVSANAPPVDARVGSDGQLHVATDEGFFVGEDPKPVREFSSPRPTDTPDDEQGEPGEEASKGTTSDDFRMSMFALGVAWMESPPPLGYSPDGKWGFAVSGGKLEVFRTGGYGKVFETAAQSCGFSADSRGIACIVESEPEVWMLETFEVETGDRIDRAEFINLARQRKELMDTYGQDQEAAVDEAVALVAELHRKFGIVAVSSGARHVAVGSRDEAFAGYSFESGGHWKPPSKRVIFVGDRLVSLVQQRLVWVDPAELPAARFPNGLLSD